MCVWYVCDVCVSVCMCACWAGSSLGPGVPPDCSLVYSGFCARLKNMEMLYIFFPKHCAFRLDIHIKAHSLLLNQWILLEKPMQWYYHISNNYRICFFKPLHHHLSCTPLFYLNSVSGYNLNWYQGCEKTGIVKNSNKTIVAHYITVNDSAKVMGAPRESEWCNPRIIIINGLHVVRALPQDMLGMCSPIVLGLFFVFIHMKDPELSFIIAFALFMCDVQHSASSKIVRRESKS